jgi:hypothetical protein
MSFGTVFRGAGSMGVMCALAVALSACGGSSSSSSSSSSGDPVSTALQTPGVRQVVIPAQRADLTIVIPTCDQAESVKTGSTKPPPGSNRIIVPQGTETETIAVQPCQGGGGGSSGGGSSPPAPPSSTILMTPGGAGTTQQSSGSQSSSSSSSGSSQPNQLVLPNNSSVTTLIVPPCTQASGDASQQANKSLTIPGKGTSVTAPPCTVPQQSRSSS